MAGKIYMSLLKKRQKFRIHIMVYLFFLLMLNTTGYSQNVRSKVNDGNERYLEEKYEEALNNYQDALIDDPQNEISQFNRGNALYKLDKFDKALEAYQNILGSEEPDTGLRARHYGRGFRLPVMAVQPGAQGF